MITPDRNVRDRAYSAGAAEARGCFVQSVTMVMSSLTVLGLVVYLLVRQYLQVNAANEAVNAQIEAVNRATQANDKRRAELDRRERAVVAREKELLNQMKLMLDVKPVPADVPATEEPEEQPVEWLPEYKRGHDPKPLEPNYIRMVVDPETAEEKVLTYARRVAFEAGVPGDCVIDVFKSAGPLKWSGAFEVSKSARTNWLWRVTLKDKSATFHNPKDIK